MKNTKSPFKLIIILLFLFSISLVSAGFEFDNKQDIKNIKGKAGYYDIEIGNLYGLGEVLWKGSLEENTHSCGENCYSIQTINLTKDGVLVNDVKFETILEDGSRKEQPIRSYKFYIKDGETVEKVNDYTEECHLITDSKNGTKYNKCEMVLSGNHDVFKPIWKEYILGTEKKKGIYELKLEGKKKPTRAVDFILEVQGEKLRSWAVWGGSNAVFDGLIHYYNMDANFSGSMMDIRGLEVGNQRNGTLFASTQETTGVLGNAYESTAGTSSVGIMNVSLDDNPADGYTISMWVYARANQWEDVWKRVLGAGKTVNFDVAFGYPANNIRITSGNTEHSITPEVWTNVIYINNASGEFAYVNGTLRTTNSGDNDVTLWIFGQGGDFTPTYGWEGKMDEIGIWNRSLSTTEIQTVWNNGNCLEYATGSGITINSPGDNLESNQNNQLFNCTATQSDATITNMSLWTNISGIWEITNTTTGLSGNSNESAWNLTVSSGKYSFTCQACDSDGDCGFAENRTITIDNTSPNTIINYPLNTAYGDLSMNFNITSTDSSGMDSCWFTLNSGVNNYTMNNETTNDYNYTNSSIGEGSYTAYFYCNDTLNNINNTESVTFSIDTSFPSLSNIIWKTTGGFTDDTLNYGQVLDYVNATCSDTNLVGCNITVTDPDDLIIINNQAMNGSSNFTYGEDITLNKVGNWTLNITAIDSIGNINSTLEIIVVSIQTQSIKDGWYGYSNSSILTQAEISYLSTYGYDIFEMEKNVTDMQSNFSIILNSINNSKNSNIKTGFNIKLNFDYNNSALRTQYLNDISENFSLFNTAPYSDSMIYFSLELVDQEDFNDTIKYGLLNNLAENIVEVTDNKFTIFSKNYNNSNLDSSYLTLTDLIYLYPTDEESFIETQKSLFKNNDSLNRIYTEIPTNIMILTQDFHNRIIDSLRSIPNPGSLTNSNASSLNNNDVLIFNNGSSTLNFTINVSALSLSGKDVWDSTEGIYIESNTDELITIQVKGYNVSIIYFEDLDHIQLSSFSEGVLYKGSFQSVKTSNYTNGTLDGNFGMYGANDIQIELFDPHYTQSNFITYYGWLNVSTIPSPKGWENYDVVILADKNDGELDALNYSATEFYGYISVADYNDSQGWTNAKMTEVDNWLSLNDSLNIFVDGLDTGIGGNNFSIRMKDLIDYIQITKARKGILNTYTAYEDFATWGNGGIMKESCINRWNGINAGTPDNYSRENWTLELEKSQWFSAHNVDVYCQSFGNRTSDGTFTILNYTELQNIYFASKVLGYDFFYLSQPDFQYTHEEWVYDVGEDLDRDAHALSSDPNTYFRTYENGIVYYNSTSQQGWIDDGLIVNELQTCFYLYNPHANNPEWRFNINNRNPVGSVGEYSFTKDWAVGTWKWKCADISTEIPINGRYLIEAWVGSHTTIIGQGYNMGWSNYTDSGKHSWYDTSTTDSYTAYPTDRNWMVNITSNISNKISVDTTKEILQTELDGTGVRNITINSSYSFPIEIWSKPTTYYSFGNVSFFNSTGSWINLNYENNTNCDSDSPTWGTTSIESLTYKACIEDSGGGTIVRVATPSLSEKIFQITSQDVYAPNLTINYPTNSTLNVDSINFNITVLDGNSITSCWYTLNNGIDNITLTNTTYINDYNSTNSSMAQGSHTAYFYCNDTLNNINNTESVTFYIESAPPTINLISPGQGSQDTDGIVNFKYTPITTSSIDSCSFYYQDGIYTTMTSIQNNAINTLEVTGIESGHALYMDNLQWYITCIDNSGNTGTSSIFNLDTREDYSGGGGGGGTTTELNPKNIIMAYPNEWQQKRTIQLNIEVRNIENKKYEPKSLNFNFNISGITLIAQRFNNDVEIYENFFEISEEAKLGNNSIKVFANDERTIENEIKFTIVPFDKDKPYTEPETPIQDKIIWKDWIMDNMWAMIFAGFILFLLILFFIIVIKG